MEFLDGKVTVWDTVGQREGRNGLERVGGAIWVFSDATSFIGTFHAVYERTWLCLLFAYARTCGVPKKKEILFSR